MRIETTRFGWIDCPDEKVIHIASGLIGFPEREKYILLEHRKGSPFLWLQSVEDGSLAFVLIDPHLFKPDYEIQLSPDDMRDLHLTETPDGIQTLVIVNIATGPKPEITANLLGPIVLNVKKRVAKQIVLPEGKYSLRHPIPTNGIR